MGGWISILICVLAAFILSEDTSTGAFKLSVGVVIANIWSFGVMHNYRDTPESAPNSWTNINMISTILGIGLFIYSFTI